jgi:Helicase conserved C-terminal domain
MVATDAAGEGINLQVCWLMVNYDIPWNPARLEQRMGRIHRYGQKHDPVVILNLVAGKTREGRVLQTLLKKLEDIRKELGNDKVFDVIGKLFEGLSLREYMEQIAASGDERAVQQRIDGKLTPEQVRALEAREHAIYGDGGAVKSQLPRLRADMEQETYHRLLPGYVRHFIERAAPLIDIGIEGDMDGIFTLRPLKPGAMDWLLPILETYPLPVRDRYTVYPPRDGTQAMFLHPGELAFDRFRAYFCDRFSGQALQGAVFVDPTAERSYFYHLAQVVIARQADPSLRTLSRKVQPSSIASTCARACRNA